ncbi:MAG: cadherin-like domain-containing protein, partial [Anaerolineae bacterium]|nr:cadherin-like domain-containing protein [Anaerolineae bacterium]
GDLDADGDLDVYAGNVRYGLVAEALDSVWINDGDGGFVSTGQEIGAWDSLSVDLGDVDGDGDLDVLAGTSNGVEQPNMVLRNYPTPPVARDVVVVVARDVAAVVDVLAGDRDLDGSVLSVGVVGEPLVGQAWTDGRVVTYVPLPGFTGQDVFTYTARDADDLQAMAEVHVSVVTETLAATVDATGGGVLLWADAQSHVVVVEVPLGAVTVTTELKLVLLPDYGPPAPPLAFAGPIVELAASRNGVPLPGFAFAAPVTLTVRTGEIDGADWDASTLGLRRWDGDAWTDTGLDPLGAGDRADAPAVLPAYSVLTLYDGKFGLLGLSKPDLTHVYLPLVLTQSDGGVHEQ